MSIRAGVFSCLCADWCGFYAVLGWYGAGVVVFMMIVLGFCVCYATLDFLLMEFATKNVWNFMMMIGICGEELSCFWWSCPG